MAASEEAITVHDTLTSLDDEESGGATQVPSHNPEPPPTSESAGKVVDTFTTAAPKENAFSWTIKCRDYLKRGMVDASTDYFIDMINDQKARYQEEVPEFGPDEYNARVIGLSTSLRDDLEGKLLILLTEAAGDLGNRTGEELKNHVLSQLSEQQWPLASLKTAMKKIEVDLGRHDGMAETAERITSSIEAKLNDFLTTPLNNFISAQPTLGDGTVHNHVICLRDGLLQLCLMATLEATDLVSAKKKLAGADLNTLTYKMANLEHAGRVLEGNQEGILVANCSLARSISTSKLIALTFPFHEMERVLRIDCTNNKSGWKKLKTEDRLNMVKDVLNKVVGDQVGTNSEMWSLRDTQKVPGGIKVTFPDIVTRYSAEKKLSQYRSGKNSLKLPFIFVSSRMVPVEFLEDKKQMENDARVRLSQDWASLMKRFKDKGGNLDLWETHPDTVKKCFRLRTKWKVKPSLTIWTEAQDPLHRYVWRPLKTAEDFFEGYDLLHEVPCPHTRLCLDSNPSWKRYPHT